MSAQTIVTPSGERLVMLPEAEYEALIDAADDASDRAAVQVFRRRLAEGTEELVPAAVLDRILAGENRIRVWREHRGLAAPDLADRIGIGTSLLSDIEAGRSEASLDTLRRIATGLSLTLDDLAG